MHVLIVSYFFPPYNTIGAVRAGKFARYLTALGHQVSVIAADAPALEQEDLSLSLELERSRVTYTRWWDVNASVRAAAGLLQRRRSSNAPATSVAPSLDGLPPGMLALSKLYLSVLNIPDAFWGWQPFAYRAARQVAQRERPDVILASGPPFSAFQVAARLSRALGVPWVADFRDLWADKHIYPFAAWRRRVDLVLEKAAMRGAGGFVSVSIPLVDALARRYPHLPHELVLNGFDSQDYPSRITPDSALPLVVRYTGTLFYVGNNNPAVLLRALARLADARRHIRVEFVLRDFAPRLQQMAAEAGVADAVRVLPPVPYAQSLALQQSSDILLLILPTRDDPAWDGVFSGKFFEYCGAGRPILAIAANTNVAARAVREHSLGMSSSDADEIADWLSARIEEKRTTGRVASFDAARVQLFTRQAQTARLEKFLVERVLGWPA